MARSRATSNKRRTNKKWSPVFVSGIKTVGPYEGAGNVYGAADLCANASATSTAPTATVIKCGNFKVYFDFTLTGGAPINASFFICYLPEGISPGYGIPEAHPEWVMAWRSFDGSSSSFQAVSLQTKLKRNLNSGDKVILLVRYTNPPTTTVSLDFGYQCSYVCCNN